MPSSADCDDIAGGGGFWTEAPEGGATCIHRADSHCCVCWGVLQVDSVLHAHASVLFWILLP